LRSIALALTFAFAVSGCSSLLLTEGESMHDRRMKQLQRVPIDIVTLGMAEIFFSRHKRERAREESWRAYVQGIEARANAGEITRGEALLLIQNEAHHRDEMERLDRPGFGVGFAIPIGPVR
jgi:hypothetical protein